MNDQPGLGPQTPNQNRRNFFLYAAIALLIMMLLNAFVMPMLHGANITEVDYGTFMDMAEEQNLGQVEVGANPAGGPATIFPQNLSHNGLPQLPGRHLVNGQVIGYIHKTLINGIHMNIFL